MKKFNYFGLFLDLDVRDELMDMLNANEEYNMLLEKADKIFIEHCTLIHVSQLHGNSEIYNYLNDRIGEKYEIVINGIGISDKAAAFRVAEYSVVCVNEIPHITITTFNDGKPVDSNNITEWKDIEPIIIKTTLKKI
jgi:hypothetical protein